MNKLLSIIALAIAAVAGYRKAVPALQAQVDSLQSQIADKDREIADLKSKVEADQADDAELERRATEAESQRAEAEKQRNDLQAQLDEAAKAGDQLAAALADEPVVPTVNPETFEVTDPGDRNFTDLAFRERESENAGQNVGEGVNNPPPPVQNLNEGKDGDQSNQAAS